MIKSLLFFILFSLSLFAKGDKENSILAYEKGKAAEMRLEITKLKTDNFVDLTIDRNNRKIYVPINVFKNFSNNICITDDIGNIQRKNDIFNEFSSKVITFQKERFLEIDYTDRREPETLFFWVFRGRDLIKLYTGKIRAEYIDFSKLANNIKFDKTVNEKLKLKDYKKVNIGNFLLREEFKDEIILKLEEKKYFLVGQEDGESLEIDLYFENQEKSIKLSNNKGITLYGEIKDIYTKNITSNTFILKDDKNQDVSIKLISKNINSRYNIDFDINLDRIFKSYIFLDNKQSSDISFKIIKKGFLAYIDENKIFLGTDFFNNKVQREVIFYDLNNKILKSKSWTGKWREMNLEYEESLFSILLEKDNILKFNMRNSNNEIGKIEFIVGKTKIEINNQFQEKNQVRANVVENLNFGKVKRYSYKQTKARIEIDMDKGKEYILEIPSKVDMKLSNNTKYNITANLEKGNNYVQEGKFVYEIIGTLTEKSYNNSIPGDYYGEAQIKIIISDKSGKFN